MTANGATHGTRARYETGCRCGECRGANTRYQRGYRMRYRGDALAAYVARTEEAAT